ncbi:hypothetical protein A9G41_05345 [Gilliamella sp. Nev5-1]|uniref:hypothetical protein n=1 Tax=Gilliamella sp. Nev5-1 TaxID=3120251 RepID=UPI000829019F|nr:hypothetical protein [Gilliamella apicola]OCG69728.1 hypothetical protein A9G41_05345 [Gilliamella apicola]
MIKGAGGSMIASLRLLSRGNAYKCHEYSKNSNSDNACNGFLASCDNNLRDDPEGINELKRQTRPTALIERFKT